MGPSGDLSGFAAGGTHAPAVNPRWSGQADDSGAVKRGVHDAPWGERVADHMYLRHPGADLVGESRVRERTAGNAAGELAGHAVYSGWLSCAVRSRCANVWSRFHAMVAFCCTSGRNSQYVSP